ncbi:ABC transporter permease [Nocardioidaceae bacterium SCSIO 66511]|nr:ABC transporter permease [Nocardioidaceae bacterium SCSIO 66511]
MIRLAYRSLRSRATEFTACFLSIFLGSAMITAFVSLSESGQGNVSAADEESLTVMGSVIGGWAIVIVLFSVVSTLGITIRQRASEIGLLRTIGTTPRQLRRMVVAETSAVAAGASVLALIPGCLLGRWILSLVKDAEMVSADVDHSVGAMTLLSTPVAMVLSAAIAATVAVRRAAKASARDAERMASNGGRMGKLRVIGAVLMLTVAISYASVTVTVMDDSSDPYGAMSTAGPASVFASVGLALLAPVLLRAAATIAGGPMRLGRVAGYLAAFNARRRALELSSVLMPVVIFVGIATGTLYLMAIQADVTEGVVQDAEAKNIEFLNYVVVGMIAAFAAIMIVNTLVAAMQRRRREFGQQRLTGATPGQLLGMVGFESVLLTAVGIVLGVVASTATIVPYSLVKLDQPLPDNGLGLLIGVVVLAGAVTIGSGVASARRGLQVPALEAAALPA